MKINHGVKFSWKDKYDPRKLKRSKKFGAVDFDINSITEFDLCPDVTIFNQAPNGQETYMCTAMANCGVSSIQEGVDLSPEYAYQKTNLLMGVKTSTGADPYKALSVHTKFGCIERKDSPLTLGPDSKFLIENPDNWDKGLDEKAKIHRKNAYFDCDQGKDKFESILSVMWESYQKFLVTKNKSDLRPVSCGFYWFGEMQYAPNGIVPNISKPKKEAGNHNVYARLAKKINGEWCIGFTNSYGREIGDNGVHYMTRDVVNRYIVFKQTFEDLDPNEEKKAQWGWVAIILNKLVESLTKLSELLQKKEELKQEVKIETKPEETMNKTDLGEPMANKFVEQLYLKAKELIGTDTSPIQSVFGCAESVNYIHKKAFGDEIGGGASTWNLWMSLRDRRDFEEIFEYEPGAIIISPTGTQPATSKIRNGHVGICGYNCIMSNDSVTGKFGTTLTKDSWINSFVKVGGFPVYYFRKINNPNIKVETLDK